MISQNDVKSGKTKYSSTAIIPYRPNTAEEIRRVLEKCNIRTVFRADNTLHKNLVRLKDPIPKQERMNCIYCLKCTDCDQTYVGQTGRQLKTRVAEHRRCDKNPPKNSYELEKLEKDSAIALHALIENHKIDFDNPTILQEGFQSYAERCVAESIHIIHQPTSVNRNSGCDLSPIWQDLIRFQSTNTRTKLV
jgi:hypothetical protein